MLSSPTTDPNLVETITESHAAIEHRLAEAFELPDRYLPNGHLVAGRYVVIRAIGEGATGIVYEAFDAYKCLGVALKMLARKHAGTSEQVWRFRREWQWASSITHDHVCKILSLDIHDDGTPFIVMELLRGYTLKEMLRRWGSIPETQIIPIVLDLHTALQAVHERGIVHRDIKPANIFLDTSNSSLEQLKLLDFGVSKSFDEMVELTMAGSVLGTPYYMSPEQVRSSADIDHRTDLWSVGVILYQAVTGHYPFRKKPMRVLSREIVNDGPSLPSCHTPEISRELEVVIIKALEKDPSKRFQSAVEFASALRLVMMANNMYC